MNEKEAREILEMYHYQPQSPRSSEYHMASGYIQAIEKAKVLENAAKDMLRDVGSYPDPYRRYQIYEKALTQWEKKK